MKQLIIFSIFVLLFCSVASASYFDYEATEYNENDNHVIIRYGETEIESEDNHEIINYNGECSAFVEEQDPYAHLLNQTIQDDYVPYLNWSSNVRAATEYSTEYGNFLFYDTAGHIHHLNADADTFDQVIANTFQTPLTVSTIHNATGDYINITSTNQDFISYSIEDQQYRIFPKTHILELYNGTNETPMLNRVYALSDGLHVSLTEVTVPHAMISRVYQGSSGSEPYVAALDEDGTSGALKRIQRRFRKSGLLYEGGYDFNVSELEINVSSGQHINGIYDVITTNSVNSSVQYFEIHSDATFHWHDNINDILYYSNGAAIGTNKYVNVVWGVTQYNGEMHLMAVVQNEPTTEYNSMTDAYEDTYNTLNLYPSDPFVKLYFMPVARTIYNTLSEEFVLLPDGTYAIDYRGGVAGGLQSGGGIPETDPVWTADKPDYVPYTNANQNVNIGTYNLSANKITANNTISINVTNPTYKHEFGGFDSSDAIRSHMGFDIYSVPDPSSITGVTSVGGSVDDGIHYYKVTFYTDIGETHPRTSSVITTGSGNNTVTLTFPVSDDPRVIGRKIYRTESGDQTYQERLLATINNNIDTEYIDTAPDSALTGDKGVVNFKADTTAKQITVEGVQSMTLDSQVSLFGVSAGASLTSGGRSTFIGRLAGNSVSTGNDNTFVGHQTGQKVVSGGRNTGMGNYAYRLGTGSYNTCYGAYSCFNILSGNDNTMVGTSAGQVMTGGSNNVFIGEYAGGTSNQGTTVSRSVAIGSEAYTTKNYQLVLGNDITEILLSRLNETKVMWGENQSSYIQETGSYMEINPDTHSIGGRYLNITDDVFVDGVIQPTTNYNSADGTSGATGTIDLTTATSITVKNGLITGWS